MAGGYIMSSIRLPSAMRIETARPLSRTGILQRACACGQHSTAGEECASCRSKRTPPLQRSALSNAPAYGPASVQAALRGPSQPLDAATRQTMEAGFGHDFSRVRVHSDAQAAQSARVVNARAYTMGPDIVFAAGQYAPSTTAGQRLLAHELTHVVQQRGSRTTGSNPPSLEQEAQRSAHAILAGQRIAVQPGTAVAGHAQHAEGEHPGAQPTAADYIAQHTNWIGDLKEEQLASDLYLLAWESSSHYDFVLEVFAELDEENQVEVGEAFFQQLGDDTWLEEMALNEAGRNFLTGVADNLPKKHRQRERVMKIVLAGPQKERETERKAAIEALKKKGNNVDITLYTSYSGMDPAESLLEGIAKNRAHEKRTDAAFPMEYFEDIGAYLEAIAQQTGATAFVRELHLMGHGTEDNFGFGRYYYNSATLQKFGTGILAPYMADGASIYMEGCAVAKGEAGKKYLAEIGRIFFGDKKSGYIKGNTCTILGIGELTECDPRTLHWPSDFK